MPLFLELTHKQCILSQLHTTALPCFPKHILYTLAGFEPGSSVPAVDAMSSAFQGTDYSFLGT
jgi:hypothetical protein